MAATILTKQARDGRAIEVRLDVMYQANEEHGTIYVPKVYVGGQFFTSGNTLRLGTPKGDVTHCIGSENKAVGFTATEAELIETALRDANAQGRAEFKASKQGQDAALKAKRQDLVDQLNGLLDDEAARIDAVMEDESNDGAYRPRSLTLEIDAAKQAIREFDTSHPAILQALRAEKQERARRFAEIDG